MGHKQTMAREARQNEARDVVLSHHDGIGISELSGITGIPISTLNEYLRNLRDEGQVDNTLPRGGHSNRWGPVGIRQRYEEANAEKLRALAVKRERARELEAMRKAEEAVMAAFEDQPVHRIVPAHLAAPLRPQGPCSIFRMAA